jgi:uncharacterized membrane protein (UPF0127 family)
MQRMTSIGRLAASSVRLARRNGPWQFVAAVLLLLMAGCSGGNITYDVNITVVTFPNGTKITAETMRRDWELLRRMMYRESLAQDRGMLFVHPEENIFHYWMYQTKIPLDIIWMDHDRRIVEMSLNTPPCLSASASECTNYGGNFKSIFVLEVNAGVAEKNNVKVGDRLTF